MVNEGFVISLAIGLGWFFAWAFRALPGDGWQMLAATPVKKDESGQWQGLNLTYYGFFTACSNTLGALILLLLPVAPLQAITAALFTMTALLGTYLFLKSYFPSALLLTIVSTQGWRFLSEFFRADNRGPSQTLSAYQRMALINILYRTPSPAFKFPRPCHGHPCGVVFALGSGGHLFLSGLMAGDIPHYRAKQSDGIDAHILRPREEYLNQNAIPADADLAALFDGQHSVDDMNDAV
jgi:hypothetical protein